jgi:hypothetical protein
VWIGVTQLQEGHIVVSCLCEVACSYRMLYAVALGCPRLWLGWWLTCSLAGGWVVALRVSYC